MYTLYMYNIRLTCEGFTARLSFPHVFSPSGDLRNVVYTILVGQTSGEIEFPALLQRLIIRYNIVQQVIPRICGHPLKFSRCTRDCCRCNYQYRFSNDVLYLVSGYDFISNTIIEKKNTRTNQTNKAQPTCYLDFKIVGTACLGNIFFYKIKLKITFLCDLKPMIVFVK